MNAPDHSNAATHGHRIHYTQAEDTQLLRHHRADGMSWREVQARMPHRSLTALKDRYYALPSPEQRPGRRVVTKSEMAEAARLRESGMLWRDIANVIGEIHPDSLRRHYITGKYIPIGEERKGPWTETEDQWLAATPARKPKGWVSSAVTELRRSAASIRARVFELRNREARKATGQVNDTVVSQALPKVQHGPSDQPAPSQWPVQNMRLS